MGQFPTPGLKHPVDIAPANLSLLGALIVFAAGCLGSLLFTLGYATYLQLGGLELPVPPAIGLCVFGFVLPAVNLYLISRASPASRWLLLVNLVGLLFVYALLVEDAGNSFVSVLWYGAAPVVLFLAGVYFLVVNEKLKQYYRVLRTGVVTDERLLKSSPGSRLILSFENLLYGIVEKLIIIMALAFFVLLLFFHKLG